MEVTIREEEKEMEVREIGRVGDASDELDGEGVDTGSRGEGFIP
jgi:hypothetical protein